MHLDQSEETIGDDSYGRGRTRITPSMTSTANRKAGTAVPWPWARGRPGRCQDAQAYPQKLHGLGIDIHQRGSPAALDGDSSGGPRPADLASSHRQECTPLSPSARSTPGQCDRLAYTTGQQPRTHNSAPHRNTHNTHTAPTAHQTHCTPDTQHTPPFPFLAIGLWPGSATADRKPRSQHLDVSLPGYYPVIRFWSEAALPRIR